MVWLIGGVDGGSNDPMIELDKRVLKEFPAKKYKTKTVPPCCFILKISYM